LDVTKLPQNAVLLNVYDVSDTEVIQRINRFTTANNAVLVGGVFHGGVEVYGREWSYGCTEDRRTGVGAVPPRCHPQHTYRSTVHIGNTNLSREEVGALLARLAAAWPGNEYSLIHRNCINFCNALLQELGLRRVPGWVDRAARAASQVDTAVRLLRGVSADQVKDHLEAHVSEVHGAVQGQLAEALEAADKARAELVEKVLPDLAQADPIAKAAELGERAQEQVSALASNLWAWTQDLSGQLAADGKAPTLDSISAQAEETFKGFHAGLQQLGEDLHKTLEGPSDARQRRLAAAIAAQGDKRSRKSAAAAAPRSDDPATMSRSADVAFTPGDDAARSKAATASVWKQEEKQMASSLLDGSDTEDEEEELDVVQMAHAAMSRQAAARGSAPPPPMMDLLGDVSPAKATSSPADLLGDFNPNLRVKAAAPEPLPRVSASWPAEVAPASCGASSDLMDFVAQSEEPSRVVDPLDLLGGDLDLLAC